MQDLKLQITLVILMITAFGGTLYFRIPSDRFSETKPLIVPPQYIKNTSFGFKILLSDALWIRILQNDDFCEVDKPKAKFNSAVLLEDALKTKLEPSRCHKGWLYQMIDLATELNPRFMLAYKAGGLMLSIGADDREGARLIFEKGIRQDFDDWQLLYRAAYHYIFEIQDKKRAGQILALASTIPEVPGIIPILASRIEKSDGRLQMAHDTLEEYLKTAKTGTESYSHALARFIEVKQQLEAEKKHKKNKPK